MQYKVNSSSVFKQGTGKKGPWTIYQVQLEGYPTNDRITGFDVVNPGDIVTVTQKQNGDYVNLNYEKVDGAAPTNSTQPVTAPAPAAPGTGVGGSDARVLKLVVLMAEQMGIDKNEIMSILQG